MSPALRCLPVVACLLGACHADGRPGEQATPGSGMAYLDSVAAGIGGSMVLDTILSLAVQYLYTQWATTSFQDGRDEVRYATDVLQVRDFLNGRTMFEAEGEVEGRRVWERVVITPQGSFVHDFTRAVTVPVADQMTELTEYATLHLRWYPYHVFVEARTNPQAVVSLPDTTIDDRRYHQVQYYDDTDATVHILIDDDWRIRAKRTSQIDDAGFRRTLQYDFDAYQVVEGIPLPLSISVTLNGNPLARFEIADARFNAAIRESAFQPPTAR